MHVAKGTYYAQEGDGDYAGGGDFEDSADVPGYEELGDEYEQLNYGNEVIHVTDTIAGLDTEADEADLEKMFGGCYDEKDAVAGKAEYRYYSNNDGTHRKYSTNPADCTEENCAYDAAGKCALCGHVKAAGGEAPAQGGAASQKQALKVDTTAKRIRASRLKKKARYTSKVRVKGAKTKVTYARLKKGSSARLTINSKTGKIKVRRGTPKGTYRIRVKVTAAKTAKYKAASQVVTIKVKVI